MLLLLVSALAIALAPPANAAPAPATADFITVLQRNFGAWDKDRNNQLSPQEIEAALADPKLSGDDAAAAGTIKCVSRDGRMRIRRIDIATIKDDLRIVQSRKPNDGFTEDWFAPDWQEAFTIARKRGQAIGTPFQEPDLASLRADAVGNDALIATLGAQLALTPEVARVTVYSLPDGKLQLMLPLWKKPFGPITEAQTAGASTTGNVWARAVECGIDLLNQERFPQAAYDGRIMTFEETFARAQNCIRLLAGNQSSITAFRSATGMRNRDGFEYRPLGTSDGLASQASQILGKALTQKQIAIALTHGAAIIGASAKGPASPGPLPRGIKPYSYFAIVSMDPKTKTITLWSPTGANFSPTGDASAVNGYPTVNGKWTMPLNDFTLVFSGFVVESNNKATLPGENRGRR